MGGMCKRCRFCVSRSRRLHLGSLRPWPSRLPVGAGPGENFFTFFMSSEVPSFCVASGRSILAVCFSLIKFTVSCFRNFFRAFVGRFSFFKWLVWLYPSDMLLFSQDSLLFCWNSRKGVVLNVSQYWKKGL